MIEVRVGALERSGAQALLRPVAGDWGAVTPAMRRFDLAAGAAVAAQCERLGELPVGSAAITAAGPLQAEFIVHVAVRSRDEGVTAAVVRRALVNGLRRLEEWAVESAAIVPLGTGAGNLDAEGSAEAMIPVLVEHMTAAKHPRRVTVVVETEYEESAFVAALRRHGRTGTPAGRDTPAA